MYSLQKILLLAGVVVFIGVTVWYLFGTTQIVQAPTVPHSPEDGETVDEMFQACTADAKQCPDGSFVGRSGPDCEFRCPMEELSERTMCTEEMKQVSGCDDVYTPVCGLVEVQCITTPCYPVPETFANGCSACAQGDVASYVEGECTIEVN